MVPWHQHGMHLGLAGAPAHLGDIAEAINDLLICRDGLRRPQGTGQVRPVATDSALHDAPTNRA